MLPTMVCDQALHAVECGTLQTYYLLWSVIRLSAQHAHSRTAVRVSRRIKILHVQLKEPYMHARKEPVVSTIKITFCLQFYSLQST
jgi:hypothetical protein